MKEEIITRGFVNDFDARRSRPNVC